MTEQDIIRMKTDLTRAERRDWYTTHRRDADAVAVLVRHAARTALESPHVETMADAVSFGCGYLESLTGHGMHERVGQLGRQLAQALTVVRGAA